MVKLLVESGADVNAKARGGDHGSTPLAFALQRGDQKIAELLKEQGAVEDI